MAEINELMGSKQSVQSLHNKARTSPYPRTKDVIRANVPDDKVPWKVGYDYKPVQYTSEAVLKGPVWADPDIKPGDKHNIRFNTIDRNVNRKSFICKYDVVDSLPRNPMGRTGLAGRGSLGRWGPNHAADPIVTRWKNKDKRILQFIAVQRKDNGEWAIPGGMVDPGEVVSQTLRREFGEEALNSLEASADDKKHIEESLDKLFHTGKEIYKGYVDDPRNTDNSWMETVAMNFHDENGDSAALFKLNAGDDAMGVQWMDVCQKTKLYASHEHFVQSVAHLHKAEW